MKRILTLLPIAALFFACSMDSMEVEDEELYGNMLPDDFVLAEFSEINPDIAVSQILDTVAILNKNFKGTDREKSEFVLTFAQGDGKRIAIDYLLWDSSKVEDMIFTIETRAAAGLMPNTRAEVMWTKYVIFSEQSELALLEDYLTNKLDSSLILQSYVKYARKDGRPYRKCKEDELGNQAKNVIAESIDYSDLSFCYDVDNKTVREINKEDL